MRWLMTAFLLLLWAGTAQANPLAITQLPPLQLEYGIYLGGLHVMDSTARFQPRPGAYNLRLHAAITGWLRKLLPWDADLDADGTVDAASLTPQRATILTRWQQKLQTVSFDFNGTAIAARFDPPQSANTKEYQAVPDALKQGAIDPLNGVMQVMAALADGKGCTQTIPIYDGHRRFDLVLHPAGERQLEASAYSSFHGIALRCRADLAMRAGSRKDREGSRFWEDETGGETASRPPIFIYLASPNPGLPPLPVRAETATPFGNVVVHLARIQAGGA